MYIENNLLLFNKMYIYRKKFIPTQNILLLKKKFITVKYNCVCQKYLII